MAGKRQEAPVERDQLGLFKKGSTSMFRTASENSLVRALPRPSGSLTSF